MDPRVQDKALLRAQRDHVVEQIGSGGYRFASLEELDAVVKRWQSVYQELVEDGVEIQRMIALIRPPAADYLSTGQAKAAVESLNNLRTTNEAAQEYTHDFIGKLTATQQRYSHSEQHGAHVMTRVDEGS